MALFQKGKIDIYDEGGVAYFRRGTYFRYFTVCILLILLFIYLYFYFILSMELRLETTKYSTALIFITNAFYFIFLLNSILRIEHTSSKLFFKIICSMMFYYICTLEWLYVNFRLLIQS